MHPKIGGTGNWRYQVVQGKECQAETVDLGTLHVQRHFSRHLLPDRIHNGANHICS